MTLKLALWSNLEPVPTPEPGPTPVRPEMAYEPLPSVWDGDDADLLERMLSFYPSANPALILDATVNSGRFWSRSTRPVIGLDIDPKYHPDVLGTSSHRLQWAHVDFIKAADREGFTACDCIVKVRKGPIVDPRWKVAHHARRHHCYWLIFRKSARCE